jgi:hypothetical protein
MSSRHTPTLANAERIAAVTRAPRSRVHTTTVSDGICDAVTASFEA